MHTILWKWLVNYNVKTELQQLLWLNEYLEIYENSLSFI